MTTDNTDLLTDDEALRESAMTDGPRALPGGLTLRPITALSMSWLRRLGIFTDPAFDELFRTAAFAYLHTEELKKVRTTIRDRDAFLDSVDEWIMRVAPGHHSALEPFAGAMEEAINLYTASESRAKHPSTGTGSPEKNS